MRLYLYSSSSCNRCLVKNSLERRKKRFFFLWFRCCKYTAKSHLDAISIFIFFFFCFRDESIEWHVDFDIECDNLNRMIHWICGDHEWNNFYLATVYDTLDRSLLLLQIIELHTSFMFIEVDKRHISNPIQRLRMKVSMTNKNQNKQRTTLHPPIAIIICLNCALWQTYSFMPKINSHLAH